jgi:hypothetical protein
MYKNTNISQTIHKYSSLEVAMFYGKSKRVIVIKDIHSNLFEEAILVLKEDREQEQEKRKAGYENKIDNDKNEFILKEAESIINNYIKQNKHTLPPVKKRDKKLTDSRFIKNLIINSALFGSIAVVIFLLIKLI